jgi:hypothetical protein
VFPPAAAILVQTPGLGEIQLLGCWVVELLREGVFLPAASVPVQTRGLGEIQLLSCWVAELLGEE